MNTFGRNLETRLNEVGMNPNSLARLLGEDPALIHKIVRGKQNASERIMNKLLDLPQLNLSLSLLRAWRLIDEYDPDVISKAFQIVEEEMK